MCADLAKSAKRLGLDTECQSLAEDNEKLVRAAKAFEQKSQKPKEITMPKVTKKGSSAKKLVPLRPSSDQIKKLAQEKFGSPPTPKVDKLEKAEKPLKSIQSSMKSNEPVNSSLMDGESLIANDYFTNIPAHHDDVREETQSAQLQNPSVIEDKDTVISKRTSTIMTTKRTSTVQSSVKVKLLEIDSEELADIEDLKQCAQIRQLTSMPSSALNPLELVSSIADQVVKKIVFNVCHEAVDPILIDKLVQAELSFV